MMQETLAESFKKIKHPIVILNSSDSLQLSQLASLTGMPTSKVTLNEAQETIKNALLITQMSGALGLVHPSWPKSPLVFDFLSNEFRHRVKTQGKHQPLAQALGLPKGTKTVCDLTGGTGQDAVSIMSLGCEVSIFERNPIVYILLQDALERWSHHTKKPYSLKFGEGINLDMLSSDVVYFDPMYVDNSRTSLPRVEMQILADIAGKDDDQLLIIKKILDFKPKKFVLKRPPGFRTTDEWPRPQHKLTSKAVEFWIY